LSLTMNRPGVGERQLTDARPLDPKALEIGRTPTAEVPPPVPFHVVVDVTGHHLGPAISDPGDGADVAHAPGVVVVDKVDLVIRDEVHDGPAGALPQEVPIEGLGRFATLAPSTVVDFLVEEVGQGIEVMAVSGEGVASGEWRARVFALDPAAPRSPVLGP
jgi:hypothetical protein